MSYSWIEKQGVDVLSLPSSIPSFEDLSFSRIYSQPNFYPVILPSFFNHFYCEMQILHPVAAESFYQLITYPKTFSYLKQPKVSLLPVSLKLMRKNPPKSLSTCSAISPYFRQVAVKFHLFPLAGDFLLE